MRISKPDKEQLRGQLKQAIGKFRELDAEKRALWMANMDIQEYEKVKLRWDDAVAEINHIHKELYPYFPYGRGCSYCGCVTLPILGHNSLPMFQCVACETVDQY